MLKTELIDNNKNGLLFESKDLKKLANLIFILLSDKQFRKDLGYNARKKMINHFRWKIIIKRFETLFKLLERKKY